MKKLAYIILVIAILVVISHFVKQGSQQPAAEIVTISEAVAPVDSTAPTENNADTIAPVAEDADVVDVQEDIIVEDNNVEEIDAVEVEEIDPSATASEDETIINE